MTGSTDWLSAIGILLSGLVLGFLFIYTFRKNRTAAATADLDRRDLEAKRDALIRQLRELTDDEVEERHRLELEAAQVLRALELPLPPGEGGPKGRVRGEQTTETPKAAARNAGPLAGFLWGAGSVAALVLLGYYVSSKSEVKQQPNQTMPMASAQGVPQAAPVDPAVQKLEQEVSADPNNADKRIALARMYLEKQNMMGVFEQTKAVLDKNPNNARAQTYNAIVLMEMGQFDQATSMLEGATKTDPKLADAWVSLAWIRMQKGDKPGAKAAIDSGIANVPAEADRLRDVWIQMSNTPAQSTPASAAPAASDAIHVTLTLADSASIKSGVLYVIARSPGVTSGPPIAVKRLNVTSFPVTIDISSADSMMGQQLPKKIHLEARLDSDGDAATKSPTDPTAAADGVSTGATLSLTLK
ncbi:MAG TPA: tetratricopeptide repeat protein [Thermoanaerobaculia bacterium]|jgi:tetratricopeptide (TPR) repeat protein